MFHRMRLRLGTVAKISRNFFCFGKPHITANNFVYSSEFPTVATGCGFCPRRCELGRTKVARTKKMILESLRAITVGNDRIGFDDRGLLGRSREGGNWGPGGRNHRNPSDRSLATA